LWEDLAYIVPKASRAGVDNLVCEPDAAPAGKGQAGHEPGESSVNDPIDEEATNR
jgi:hypothetical protein